MKFMKRIMFVLLNFMFVCEVGATNYQEIFFKANELYKEGKYQQAQELYEQIPNKGTKVHYNLGNCAYKLKHFGYALVHWRRAEKEWGLFNRADLLHNIALVKQQVRKKNKDQDSPLVRMKDSLDHFSGVVISAVRAFPLWLLQFVFLLTWIISFLYLRYLYKKRQQFIIIFLFCLNLFCGALLAIRYNFDCREHGIIVVKKTELLSGPGKSYQVLKTLPEAKQVLVKGCSNDFYKVKVDGVVGWVAQVALEKY